MKLLMICKGQYHYFMPRIAEVLKQQHGFSVSAMTFATVTAEDSRMSGFSSVHNLPSYLKKHESVYSVDECVLYLQQLESSGVVENLNLMIHADRIIRNYPLNRVNTIVAGICRFWDGVLSEMRPDVVLGEVACASEWIAWSFARHYQIPYLIPYPGPFPRRFNFVTSPDGGWQQAADLYRKLKKSGLSPQQRSEAEAFLNRFRTNRLRSAIHSPAFRSPATLDRKAFKNIAERIKRIPVRVRTYRQDGHYEVGSYSGTAPWKPMLADLFRVMRHSVAKDLLFDKKPATGKTIYFPLHVQPEFTIDVRAPFCTNQLALVENIAKSVPGGYRLIVKDHPGMRGRRPLSYYRSLKSLYNVQVVSPDVDSHELIKNADAVLSIVGTSAWEGILYEKPVIAFGPLAYRFYDLVHECRTISDLPALLSHEIRTFTPDRDLLLKFIWSTLETAHNAEWHDPISTPDILHPENIQAIAAAIVNDFRIVRECQSVSAV